MLPYLIPKGYVTLDGASLTLTNIDRAASTFSIMLIAHSQQKLTLSKKVAGDKVNVEVDCVGKYVLGDKEGMEEVVKRLVDERLEAKLRELGLLKT
jgi:riboflavin synthase